MEPLTIASGIPIVIGLTEVIKKFGVPSRFLPLVAIAFGILFAIVLLGPTPEGILQGIMIGLAGSGLYRGAEVVVQNK